MWVNLFGIPMFSSGGVCLILGIAQCKFCIGSPEQLVSCFISNANWVLFQVLFY